MQALKLGLQHNELHKFSKKTTFEDTIKLFREILRQTERENIGMNPKSISSEWRNRVAVLTNTQAHEDFVLTVGHSYFLDYVMKKIDMKDLDDTPTHKLLPENIKQLHAPSKQKIFYALMEEAPKKMDLKLLIANQAYQCSASLDNNTAVVPLSINGRQTIIQVPVPRLQEGCSINVNGITIFIQEVKKGQDDLFNYVHTAL
ncbi:unnamed protein product [Mytilus edulis]|uniref:Uncharacterized protein n=1 Tax=Mytilus edulis TaxID=6550 RepID=A0A8S3SQB3_MYTED|nr:unnamed protein product [Mytilus edulis]